MLYEALNLDDLWDYMLNEPFADQQAFNAYYTKLLDNADTAIYYTIMTKPNSQPAGLLALMDVNTTHRSLEIGHVIYGPALQRSRAATEAIYLALQHCSLLSYSRVVWKCNDLNKPSKKAALRLGFKFDGIFKYHMVVKRKVRHTAWYAITQCTWPKVKRAMEEWLTDENFTDDGLQKRKLVDIGVSQAAAGNPPIPLQLKQEPADGADNDSHEKLGRLMADGKPQPDSHAAIEAVQRNERMHSAVLAGIGSSGESKVGLSLLKTMTHLMLTCALKVKPSTARPPA